MSELPKKELSVKFDGPPSAKKRNFSIEFKPSCINEAQNIFHRDVLTERAHYSLQKGAYYSGGRSSRGSTVNALI